MQLLYQRVTDVIRDRPGIHVAAIRAALADVPPHQVTHALMKRRKAKRVEQLGQGCYRLPQRRPAPVPQTIQAGAFALPMSKLMAGR